MSGRVSQRFDLIVSFADDPVFADNDCANRDFFPLVCLFRLLEGELHPFFVFCCHSYPELVVGNVLRLNVHNREEIASTTDYSDAQQLSLDSNVFIV